MKSRFCPGNKVIERARIVLIISCWSSQARQIISNPCSARGDRWAVELGEIGYCWTLSVVFTHLNDLTNIRYCYSGQQVNATTYLFLKWAQHSKVLAKNSTFSPGDIKDSVKGRDTVGKLFGVFVKHPGYNWSVEKTSRNTIMSLVTLSRDTCTSFDDSDALSCKKKQFRIWSTSCSHLSPVSSVINCWESIKLLKLLRNKWQTSMRPKSWARSRKDGSRRVASGSCISAAICWRKSKQSLFTSLNWREDSSAQMCIWCE